MATLFKPIYLRCDLLIDRSMLKSIVSTYRGELRQWFASRKIVTRLDGTEAMYKTYYDVATFTNREDIEIFESKFPSYISDKPCTYESGLIDPTEDWKNLL